MPYNTSFPQARDFMRDSQPLLLENFANIASFIGVDHESFNIGVAGKHKQLTFPAQATDPANANQWRMYGKNVGALIQLFTKNAANVVTGFSDSNIPNPNLQRTSWVQLPSGIILKWVVLSTSLNDSLPTTLTWATHTDTKPFTQQFWAGVFSLQDSPTTATDLDIIYYVASVATPTQVTYTAFQREGSFIGIRPGQLTRRIVFAIGV